MTIHNALSFFREAYDEFASYRAAVIRLDGLVEENSRARTFSQVTTDKSRRTARCRSTASRCGPPTARILFGRLTSASTRATHCWSADRPGSARPFCCRASPASGRSYPEAFGCPPAGRRRCSCLSCRICPSAISAPSRRIPTRRASIDDREIQQALIKVALPHLAIRLNDVGDWGKVLSVGEQQRIAFARILLTKPRAVFLDESTSALDEGLELTLYELVRAELPEMILVSVSHRATVERFHGRQLELVGGGEWRLEPLSPRAVEASASAGPSLSGYVAGMEEEMFTPTLDWGNELWVSLMWIAKGWAIAAIATLVICVLIGPVHRVGQAVLAHHRRTTSPAPRASRSGSGWGRSCFW